MRDLPAIEKKRHQSQGEESGVKYAYRGIEQITAEAQGLFAKYGVVWVPRVVERDVKELTINNRPWTEEHLVVEYSVYGPGWDHDPEDFIKVGPIHALGRDNSDKGCNKAMTQAFKYALLQTLCISDSKDDGDKETHVADERTSAGSAPGAASYNPREAAGAGTPVHPSDQGAQHEAEAKRKAARTALRQLADDGVVSKDRANEIWALYGEQDEERWFKLLQMELNRHIAEHPSEEFEPDGRDANEPTNITSLTEKAAKVQEVQKRTRPAPGSDQGA